MSPAMPRVEWYSALDNAGALIAAREKARVDPRAWIVSPSPRPHSICGGGNGTSDWAPDPAPAVASGRAAPGAAGGVLAVDATPAPRDALSGCAGSRHAPTSSSVSRLESAYASTSSG